MNAFRTLHGPTWEVIFDEEIQLGRTLFNGRAGGKGLPTNNAEWFLNGRTFLTDAHGVLGIDDDTLVDDRVLLLPLGMVGTTDKTTVRFRQEVSGVPVRGGYANALFDMQGRLLCLDHDALPNLSGFDVTPTVSEAAAQAAASQAFVAETGGQPDSVGSGSLVVLQYIQGISRAGALAWQVVARTEDAAYRYCVTAKGAATVIEAESLIHDYCSQQGGTPIQGRVKANVTQGLGNYWRGDPGNGTAMQLSRLPNLILRRASNESILTVTDANGDFSFAGGFQPIDVLLRFQGPYVDVCTLSGPSLASPSCADPDERIDHERSETVTINGTNTLIMNPNYNGLVVAQANAFYRVNEMREWIREVNPFDSTFDDDAPYRVRTNRRNFCRGAFDEDLQIVWTSRATPLLCERSTASATTLWHEMGHWMNVLYGNGNDRRGFGEGIADVWAMYQQDFFRSGDPSIPGTSRIGTNTECFCGDCPPCGMDDDCGNGCQGCHGTGTSAGHQDGLPLMGAMWKVRENLKQAHGLELGGGDRRPPLFGLAECLQHRKDQERDRVSMACSG